MSNLLISLIALLFLLSSPALQGNADFRQSSLAAKETGAITNALSKAKPVGGRLETILDDGSKVIFRSLWGR